MPNIYYYPVGVETGGSTSPSGEFVLRAGDTMTGDLGMTNNKITDVSNGVAPTDVVNKQQLDAVETTATAAQTAATAAQTTATAAQATANTASTTATAAQTTATAAQATANTASTTATAAQTTASAALPKTGGILSGTTQLNGSMNIQSGEIFRLNMALDSPSSFITTGINGTSSGVTNNLYSGDVMVAKSSKTMPAGTVVSFVDVANDTDVLTLRECEPNNGESGGSSQPIGILLEDATANSTPRVALSGIVTCIAGNNFTADRGGALSVIGLSGGKVTQVAAGTNTAMIGTCLSGGSKSTNDPILVWLHPSYEAY